MFAIGQDYEANPPVLSTFTPGDAPEGSKTVVRIAELKILSPPAAPREEASGPGWTNAQAASGLVTAGAGVAGIGVGIVLGLVGKSNWNDSAPYCDADLCDAEGVAIRDDARALGTAATVTVVVGAALLAGGVVIWLTSPADEDEDRAEQPAWLGVRLAPARAGGSFGLLGHW